MPFPRPAKAFAFALLAAPAFAAPPASSNPPPASSGSAGIVVTTADLDLSQPGDARLALDRIEAAARRACLAPGFAMRTTVRGCMRMVVAGAVRGLDAPVLTAEWKAGPRSSSQFAGR
jgi:UrcA family protein